MLQPQLVSVTGTGWGSSAADVVLSSAGWVAVTVGKGKVSGHVLITLNNYAGNDNCRCFMRIIIAVAVSFIFVQEVCLMAHTPGSRGVLCRQPALWPTAVTQRGKRRCRHNQRATFT